jgi:protein TonB
VTGVRIPFALSLAGHAAFVVALMLVARLPPPPPAPPPSGITLILAPPPVPKPPPAARPAAPTPPAVRPPKPAPPPPRPILAPAPGPMPAPPRPRRKPVLRHLVRPVPHRAPRPARLEPLRPRYTQPVPIPTPAPPRSRRPEQIPVPAAPPPAPRPAAPPQAAIITPGYRASLLEWLEAHKRYPAAARARGEEGSALLRFRIDRSGRVLDYAVVKSTGYRDLDAAVAEMMRGAILPAFPPAMPEQSLTILVPIRFSLQ